MSHQTDQTGQAKTLSDRQKQLLSILTENPNISRAAEEAGIGRSTAHRWLKEPAFQTELDSIRQRSMKEAMNSVHAYTAKAVENLARLMDSSNEWLQRQASLDLLNRSLKIREVEDMEGRISALEKMIKQQPKERTQ